MLKKKGSTHLFRDAWVTKLGMRNVISVRGRDATTILQNTIT